MRAIQVKLILAIFCLTSISIGELYSQNVSEDLEIRFQPDSVIYVYENVGPEMPKQLYSAVIHNMAFVNTSNEAIIIEGASIKAIGNKEEMQRKYISSTKIKTSAAKFKIYEEHGVLELYDFQFQTSKYLKDIKFAANDTLHEGESVVIMHEALLFDGLPDLLEVTVKAKRINNVKLETTKTIRVENYKSKNDYILPLKGAWTAAAGPSLIGHHRWGSIQEFAYDFIKIGTDQLSYKNDGSHLDDYYAYGENIYAVADGVVVSALDGITESSENLKRLDETEKQYLERMRPYQEQLMAKGFKYVFGNHVVIKHDNNEYSAYFHLKDQSLTVEPGDKVEQGQIIGELGHSGNSTEPHLHFHISDNEDVIYSRSLPVEFSNLMLFPVDNGEIRHIHSGQILRTNN